MWKRTKAGMIPFAKALSALWREPLATPTGVVREPLYAD